MTNKKRYTDINIFDIEKLVCEENLAEIRAGRANPAILNKIKEKINQKRKLRSWPLKIPQQI